MLSKGCASTKPAIRSVHAIKPQARFARIVTLECVKLLRRIKALSCCRIIFEHFWPTEGPSDHLACTIGDWKVGLIPRIKRLIRVYKSASIKVALPSENRRLDIGVNVIPYLEQMPGDIKAIGCVGRKLG